MKWKTYILPLLLFLSVEKGDAWKILTCLPFFLLRLRLLRVLLNLAKKDVDSSVSGEKRTKHEHK